MNSRTGKSEKVTFLFAEFRVLIGNKLLCNCGRHEEWDDEGYDKRNVERRGRNIVPTAQILRERIVLKVVL